MDMGKEKGRLVDLRLGERDYFHCLSEGQIFNVFCNWLLYVVWVSPFEFLILSSNDSDWKAPASIRRYY